MDRSAEPASGTMPGGLPLNTVDTNREEQVGGLLLAGFEEQDETAKKQYGRDGLRGDHQPHPHSGGLVTRSHEGRYASAMPPKD